LFRSLFAVMRQAVCYCCSVVGRALYIALLFCWFFGSFPLLYFLILPCSFYCFGLSGSKLNGFAASIFCLHCCYVIVSMNFVWKNDIFYFLGWILYFLDKDDECVMKLKKSMNFQDFSFFNLFNFIKYYVVIFIYF